MDIFFDTDVEEVSVGQELDGVRALLHKALDAISQLPHQDDCAFMVSGFVLNCDCPKKILDDV